MIFLRQKVIAFLAGLTTILLLAEFILHIVGWAYLVKSPGRHFEQSDTKGADFIVLCLGNSNTYGLGAAPEESYPKQLERLLKSYCARKTTVINEGIPSYNTAQILERMPRLIKEIKPDLIILWAGGGNFWNSWGYKQYKEGKTLKARMYNFLYRIRLFKLAKLIWIKIKELKQGMQAADVSSVAGLALAQDIRNSNDKDGITADLIEEKIDLECLREQKYNMIGNNFLRQNKPQEALEWFEKALLKNKEYKDV
ncbi:MAG: hypothetical protein KKA52_09765, partial [Candidatus Omnitrophica bacterium]|nr:hypothetical protein [Candidatus Omnitrophota bacterium]